MTGNSDDRTEGMEHAADAVRGLAPERPDPEFRRRLGQSFAAGELAAAAPAEVVPIRRSRTPLWAAAAAAAVVTISFLIRPVAEPGYVVVGGDAVGTAIVDGRELSLADLRETGLHGAAQIHVTEGALELRLSDVLAARINPGRVSVPDPEQAGAMSWDLAKGEVLFQTGPAFPGRQLRVHTPEGAVEVVGTSFAVYRDDGATCVCVLEGRASVGVDADDMEPVSPGYRKVMYADGSPSEILDVMPEHRDGLLGFVDRAKASLRR